MKNKKKNQKMKKNKKAFILENTNKRLKIMPIEYYEKDLAKELRKKKKEIKNILSLLENIGNQDLSDVVKFLLGGGHEKEKLSKCVEYIRNLNDHIDFSLSLQLHGLVPEYFFKLEELKDFVPIDSSNFVDGEDFDSYQLYKNWYGIGSLSNQEEAFDFFLKSKNPTSLFSKTVKLFFEPYDDGRPVTKQFFIENKPPFDASNFWTIDFFLLGEKKKKFEENISKIRKTLFNNDISLKDKNRIKSELAVLYTLKANIDLHFDGSQTKTDLELAIKYGSTYALFFYGQMNMNKEPELSREYLLKSFECGISSSIGSILMHWNKRFKRCEFPKPDDILHLIIESNLCSHEERGKAFFLLGDMEKAIKHDNICALRKIYKNPNMRPEFISSDHMIVFLLYALTKEESYYIGAKNAVSRKHIKWIPKYHHCFLSLYFDENSSIKEMIDLNQNLILFILSLKKIGNRLHHKLPKPIINMIISFIF